MADNKICATSAKRRTVANRRFLTTKGLLGPHTGCGGRSGSGALAKFMSPAEIPEPSSSRVSGSVVKLRSEGSPPPQVTQNESPSSGTRISLFNL